MDKEFEERICNTFFDKRYADRLFYELSSRKKRFVFLSKMCHDSEKYLGNCIYQKREHPFDIIEIEKFLGKDNCYCLTSKNEIDGLYNNINTILDLLWSNGMPYLIVNAKCTLAYLETEYNFSEHNAYFLKSKQLAF